MYHNENSISILRITYYFETLPKNIRKHKNDIFRLTELLTQEQKVFQNLPVMIEKDMREFFRRIVTEEVDLVQLGILGRTKEDVFRQLRHVYGV